MEETAEDDEVKEKIDEEKVMREVIREVVISIIKGSEG